MTTSDNQRPLRQLTVVMGIMSLADGRFLIAQRPAHKMYGGLWEFPGGKLHPDETPAQALIREFAEELDTLIIIDKLLDEYCYQQEETMIRFIPFTGRLATAAVSLLEHQQVAFVNVAELDDYCFAPPDGEILRRLKRGAI